MTIKKQRRRYKNKIGKDYDGLLAGIKYSTEETAYNHINYMMFEQLWINLTSRINDSLQFDIRHLIIDKLCNDDIIKNKKRVIL